VSLWRGMSRDDGLVAGAGVRGREARWLLWRMITRWLRLLGIPSARCGWWRRSAAWLPRACWSVRRMTRTLIGAACGERFPRRADENPGAARRCTAPWSLWNTTPGTAPSRAASAPVRQLCVVVLPRARTRRSSAIPCPRHGRSAAGLVTLSYRRAARALRWLVPRLVPRTSIICDHNIEIYVTKCSFGAVYRNQTDDLRITRGPGSAPWVPGLH